MFRLLGCGPNEIYSLDLENKQIDDKDIVLVLRALTHLEPKIKHLRLKEGNPGANMRGYRFFVISTVSSIDTLDGLSVTSDERSNAEREVAAMMTQSSKIRQSKHHQNIVSQNLVENGSHEYPEKENCSPDLYVAGDKVRSSFPRTLR